MKHLSLDALRAAGRKLLLAGLIFLISQGLMVGWYYWSNRNQPTTFGVSFSIKQAREFGVDPKAALAALMTDMNIKDFRLMSYWDEIEKTPGTYDFSDLDWQFALADSYGAHVSLAIGLRQPRWPECHEPDWTKSLQHDEWRDRLNKFIGAVVNRYKYHQSLVSYQLENEFFIQAFGTCTDFDRERLESEYRIVKNLDDNHPIILNLSHNVFGLPIRQPEPDEYGISIYRRVYSTDYIHGYVTYPIPAWYFALRAAWINAFSGRDLIVHEYQLEPWGPEATVKLSKEEQDKSLPSSDIEGRIGYIKVTGIKQVYLWGGEWLYWRKTVQNDPSVWYAVKAAINK